MFVLPGTIYIYYLYLCIKIFIFQTVSVVPLLKIPAPVQTEVSSCRGISCTSAAWEN